MERAGTQAMGDGFFDHGVATPNSNHRGTVATRDGEGRNIVLVWLFDHRGGYALLLLDAATGKSEEFPMPFPPGGDCPYASILSSRNRLYTHFNSHFVEFDPAVRAFTFHHETAPRMAMSMTEDDAGRIWSVTYPNSGVVCFDPANGQFRDYGHLYSQNWPQYQRSVAADDAGWIYFAVGNTSGQIIVLDPAGGEARPVLAEAERLQGTAFVYRDENGKVYGQAVQEKDADWYEFHKGEARKIGRHATQRPKAFVASSQALFHRAFPDGSRLVTCDLIERLLTVEDPAKGQTRELHFDYTSEGAHLMGVACAPDGTICGGTAFPMRFFRYAPKTDAWTNHACYGQCNTVARQGDRFFVGGYTAGFLLEWDPARPWVATEKGRADSNPRFLTECTPDINRPHTLLAHPDGRTLIMAGTPDYGYTGGGLLFWDRATGTRTLLRHTEILPDHSTMSLAALPGGKLLGGSTTEAGTGGEQKAKQAELYILDLATRRIEWHEPVLPGVQSYMDLCLASDGRVYGLADYNRFFAFDPVRRKILHETNTDVFGGIVYQQGHRKFVSGPGGAIYVLFKKYIARVEPATFALVPVAESPVPIAFGGDFLDGRIYFGSGSHLYSCQLPG
ncbi:MAG: hypothetical protein HY343_09530 [Lentisphaerae bacterium]|nr:hypothetical protein [Lentisphaerota bacterium]